MQKAKLMPSCLSGPQRPVTRLASVTLVGCRLGLVAFACVMALVGLALSAPPARAVVRPENVGTVSLTPGYGTTAETIAVNSVTNKIYVAGFNQGIVVIDGATHLDTGNLSYAGVVGNVVGMGIDEGTNILYARNSGNSVVPINAATGQAGDPIVVGKGANRDGKHIVAVNSTTHRVYVANSADNTVTVIDGTSNTVVATLPVGTTPSGIAVDATTNKIYVANANPNSTTDRTVSVIDGATNAVSTVTLVSAPVSNKSNPYDIAVNPQTNKVYVSLANDTRVAVLNGNDNSVAFVTLDGQPSYVSVNPSTNTVYVSRTSPLAYLTVINGATDTWTNSVAFTLRADTGAFNDTIYALAVYPGTNEVYVGGFTFVSIVSGNARTGIVPIWPNNGNPTNGVAANPSTNKIYVANGDSHCVQVVDETTKKVIKNIFVQGDPTGVAVNPQNNRVYVTSLALGYLTVIDGNTDTVITGFTLMYTSGSYVDGNGVTHITYTANYPTGVAVNPATNTIYVTQRGADTSAGYGSYGGLMVSILSEDQAASAPSGSEYHGDAVSTAQKDDGIADGNGPYEIAVNPVTNKIYVSCTHQATLGVCVIDGNANYLGQHNTLVANINVGGVPGGLAVNTLTDKVYVTVDTTTLKEIDATTNTISATIPINGNSNIGGTPGLAVNEAANRIYAAFTQNFGSGQYAAMEVISGVTHQVIANAGSAPLGTPLAIAYDPQTQRIYTAGYSVLDIEFDGADTTVPVVSVSTPYAAYYSNGTYYGGGFYQSAGTNALTQATGTAQDNRSDITGIKVKLHRDARGSLTAGWWAGGSTWTSGYTDAANLLPATITGIPTNNASWTYTLPTLDQGFGDTTYTLTGVATEESGNSGQTPVNFQIDNTPPTISIAQPQDGHSYLTTDPAPTASGTAADETNGSGIALGYNSTTSAYAPQVYLRLYRAANSLHSAGIWNGYINQDGTTSWNAGDSINSYSKVFGTPNQDGTISWSKALPTLDPGSYTLRALVTDNAGNVGTSTDTAFTVAYPPLSFSITPTSFTEPNGATGSTLTGTVSIPTALTQDLTIQVNSDSSVVVPGSSPTILAGHTSATFTLYEGNDGRTTPTVAHVTASATGYTAATAQVTANPNITTVDKTSPTIRITAPADKSTVTSLATITGTATDNVGVTGLGLDLVQRIGQNSLYWNGTAWSSDYPYLDLMPFLANGKWSYPHGPTAKDITAGATYYVDVYGNDAAGNYGYDYVSVTGAKAPASSVATLTIAPATFSEAAGANAATATLKLDKPALAAMTFSLSTASTSPSGFVKIPGSVQVAANTDTVTFPVGAVDNALADGSRDVIITATATTGNLTASQKVTITDNDTAGIKVIAGPGLITSEADGTATCTVALTSQPTANVTLGVSSSNAKEGTVAPAALTFTPANWNVAQTVTITGVADNIADGDQTYSINFAPASNDATYSKQVITALTVVNKDVDTAKFSLAFSASSIVEGGTITGTVTRNTPTTAALNVTLSSSNPAVPVPASISIPAGQASATFTISTVDDTVAQGDRSTTVTATASDLKLSASQPLTVKDNDTPTLSLSIPTTMFKENGTTTGTITRNTPVDSALNVTLSSDATVASVPATVQIAAGSATASFTITGVSDGKVTGSRTTNIGAVAGTLSATPVALTATETDVAKLAAPTITALNPTSGLVSATVTITGTNFTGATGVKFNTTVAPTFTVVSATQLTVKVPTGATSGPVSVTTPGGTGVSVGAFTVLQAPTITSLSPASGPVGSLVTINGTTLDGATVKFGTATATISAAQSSGTKLVVTVPSGLKVGSVNVTVTTVGRNASKAFTVTATPKKTFSISGTVLQGTKGVAGAKVLLIPIVGTPSLATIQAIVLNVIHAPASVKQVAVAANGSYSFSGLEAGTYLVAPYKPGTPFTLAPYKKGAPIVPYAVTTASATSAAINFLAQAADSTKPTVTVKTPSGTAYAPATVPTATGTVSDTGSGVLGVGVTLAQINSLSFSGVKVSFYNWVTGQLDAPVTLTLSSNPLLLLKPEEIKVVAVTGSSWSLTLPKTLSAGNYRVLPLGVDKAFNIGYPSLLSTPGSFTVASSAHSNAVGALSLSKLSTATVSAATSSVTLKFLSALDADAASDAAHYSVTVNGVVVAVQSAGYNATAHTVTLGLPEGALRNGDVVRAQWSGLLDAHGQTLEGQTGAVTAK